MKDLTQYLIEKLYIWHVADKKSIKDEFMRIEARVKAKNIYLEGEKKELQNFVRMYINTNN